MNKRIVIIGGMGPQASLLLHKRIIDGAVTHGAHRGDDFPEIVHLSLPVQEFIDDTKHVPEAVAQINAAAERHLRGDEAVVIACNTAHLLVPHLNDTLRRRLISLIDLTVDAVKTQQAGKVGLLASPTTIKSRLYERALLLADVRVLLPSTAEQAVIERAIRDVIAGKHVPVNALDPIVARLRHKGVDRVILGCSELSIIFDGIHDELFIDPLRLAANKLLDIEATTLSLHNQL